MFRVGDYVVVKPFTNKRAGNIHSAQINRVYIRNMPQSTIFKVVRVNTSNKTVLLHSPTYGTDEYTTLRRSNSNVETKHLQKIPFFKKENK